MNFQDSIPPFSVTAAFSHNTARSDFLGEWGLLTARRAGHIERISFACMDRAKTLDARFRGHDDSEVMPAKAGIQKPYMQSQTALVRTGARGSGVTRGVAIQKRYGHG